MFPIKKIQHTLKNTILCTYSHKTYCDCVVISNVLDSQEIYKSTISVFIFISRKTIT